MLTILSWKWNSNPHYRSQFKANHVNILDAMLRRNLTIPFKHVCVTDDEAGIKKGIICYPLWKEPSGLELNPSKPNCYRRLKMYSKEAREMFGERILSIDLDCVITANFDDLIQRVWDLDFCAWNKGGVTYQGGMVYHRTGTRTFLWDEFIRNPRKARNLGIEKKFVGSDQAWVSARLPGDEAKWKPEDGVLSYKAHIRNRREADLPFNSKIVFFHGWPKQDEVTFHPWVKEHWRE